MRANRTELPAPAPHPEHPAGPRRFVGSIAALCLVALAALPAAAATADHSPELLSLLRAIDQTPPAEAVRQAAGKVQVEEALFQVSVDADLPLYPRQRAISLLSLFPGEASRAYLQNTAAQAQLQELRWAAIYTYVRSVGSYDAPAALAFCSAWLQSPRPLDREAVIRAIRHLKGPEADGLVAHQAATETDATVLAAIRRYWLRR